MHPNFVFKKILFKITNQLNVDDSKSQQVLGSIVVSIPACHAGDRGSISRRERLTYFCIQILYFKKILSKITNQLTVDDSKSQQVLGSIVVSIPACHAGDRGSISPPGRGLNYFCIQILYFKKILSQLTNQLNMDDSKSQQVLGSIVVSIPACHAGDRGSIPRRGED